MDVVSVKAILPLVVFVPLKPVTAFVPKPLSVVPPTELVVNVPPLARPEPLSEIAPLEVNDTALPLPAATLPEIVIAPVLLTVMPPVPVCEILVIVKGTVFAVREIAPPPHRPHPRP